MKMTDIRNIFLLAFFASVILSCRQNVEYTAMDYADFDTAKMPDWECYQTYLKGYDSVSQCAFLEVMSFPQRKYPGFTVPWLARNWGPYKTLTITARMRGTNHVPFLLSVWDGVRQYNRRNRVDMKFIVDTVWTECKLPLSGDLVTPAGRRLDMGRIIQIVFFTWISNNPTIFDIKKIELR